MTSFEQIQKIIELILPYKHSFFIVLKGAKVMIYNSIYSLRAHCMFGLPEQNRPITKMMVHLTPNGFLLEKKKQKFFIPHHQVTSFQTLKGLGDMRSALVNAYQYETVIEIAYQTGTDSFLVRLEIFESISVLKNYAALKGLICKMNDNAIFEKFAINNSNNQGHM